MKKDLKEFKTFPSSTIKEIQRAANEGIYQIRGLGAKRKVPDFDDLVFLGASMSRYPLEGYRETCNTSVILGDRFAKKPIKLDIPITIAVSLQAGDKQLWLMFLLLLLIIFYE